MGFIRNIWKNWQLTLLVLISMGGLYGALASFARVYDLRLVQYDVTEALQLLQASYVILVLTVIVLGVVVVGLSITVWRLSVQVENIG
ncbi:hypothetical protein [Haloferax sulfurifontis]|nr:MULTISPECIES: hypothetical protein [Haloferax]ELK44130.1 hypothetical protein D320_22124 [Haloferax sp. BAB-2207]